MKVVAIRITVIAAVTLGFAVSSANAQLPAKSETQLEQRILELERQVGELQRRLEANNGTASTQDSIAKGLVEQKTPTSQAAPIVTAGSEGFSLSSADKSYRLRVGGYVQADGKSFYDDRARVLNSSFSVRRARMYLDLAITPMIDLRLAPEFGNGSVLLYDAYADLKFRPHTYLRAGKFKAPLSLEVMQADTDLSLIERGLNSDLAPNRDIGAAVYGEYPFVSYQLGFMNGAVDGANIDGDSNDSKDFIGRAFFSPFAKSGPKSLRAFGVGLATTRGRQNGASLPAFKTSGGQAVFFSYSSSASANGSRVRYAPQLYYYNGPFGFTAEFIQSTQTVSMTVGKSVLTQAIGNQAWEMNGSWAFGGAKKSFKGVQLPKTEPSSRSFLSSWEIAARYTELKVDPTAFSLKLADLTKSAAAARTWTVGLNWYLNRNARMSFDYDQTSFTRGAPIGDRPIEKVFEQRLQIAF